MPTFKELKIEFENEIKITKENMYDKMMHNSSLYHKYAEMYVRSLKELNKLKNDRDVIYKKLYHAYKFEDKSSGYDVSKTSEIDVYVKGDKEYRDIMSKIESQDEITKYLEYCVKIIDKITFNIRMMIDYEKFRNGMI